MAEDVEEKDVFGLPKLSTNAEVGVSFTLFVLGNLLLFSFIYMPSSSTMGSGLLGMLMVGVSYLFMVEAVRELEEKDHFLSTRLMSK